MTEAEEIPTEGVDAEHLPDPDPNDWDDAPKQELMAAGHTDAPPQKLQGFFGSPVSTPASIPSEWICQHAEHYSGEEVE